MQTNHNNKEKTMGTIIRIAILSWSAALLTASYGGVLQKFDPTFIATVFTACAATFGVNTMKKGGDKDEDEKKELLRTETVVEAPPEPPATEAEAPEVTLEARVEALEEGQVQPRTGGA
jgi:type IV secretory pathway VirB10-like protein